MKVKLDSFERSIERAANNSRPATPVERRKIERILDKIRKNRNVNIRLSEEVLGAIKKRSLREGIPYQTLISSILHKYVTNQLIDEEDLRLSMKMLSRTGKRSAAVHLQ
jgi:predicted DNA binding CopG/RHH family protein